MENSGPLRRHSGSCDNDIHPLECAPFGLLVSDSAAGAVSTPHVPSPSGPAPAAVWLGLYSFPECVTTSFSCRGVLPDACRGSRDPHPPSLALSFLDSLNLARFCWGDFRRAGVCVDAGCPPVALTWAFGLGRLQSFTHRDCVPITQRHQNHASIVLQYPSPRAGLWLVLNKSMIQVGRSQTPQEHGHILLFVCSTPIEVGIPNLKFQTISRKFHTLKLCFIYKIIKNIL